jgi:curli biogenesis system outer membrane secretion channel CsgG
MRPFFVVCRSFVAALALAVPLAEAGVPRAAAAATGPTVAVLNFSTQGLTSDWYGNFEPGIALSDLVTDQLVNEGKFNVVDRKHLADVMAEHQLSTSGEVAPATFVQSGRLTGARYLITGNILQFDKTGSSGGGGGAGGLMGGVIGGALGGIHTERVTLKVQVRVIDAVTGTILQSFADEQTKGGTSWGGFGGAGSWNAIGAGGYSNEQFTSSTMGHLVNDEAGIIVNHIDPAKFEAAAPSGPAAHGRILTVDGDDIVINAGSDAGVQEGMMMDAISVKELKDPDSGKYITTEIPKGVIQIVSVTKSSSVAKRVSGTIKALEIVRSQ